MWLGKVVDEVTDEVPETYTSVFNRMASCVPETMTTVYDVHPESGRSPWLPRNEWNEAVCGVTEGVA